MVANKWIVRISQSTFNNTFHSLEEKRLVLGVDILNSLQRISTLEEAMFQVHSFVELLYKP